MSTTPMADVLSTLLQVMYDELKLIIDANIQV